jgi:hypothetical protein
MMNREERPWGCGYLVVVAVAFIGGAVRLVWRRILGKSEE